MHACLLEDNIIKPRYVYYSLSLPTVSDGSPLKKSSDTIVSDMREIKLLIETLGSHLKNKTNVDVNNLVEHARIDYFHGEKDI